MSTVPGSAVSPLKCARRRCRGAGLEHRYALQHSCALYFALGEHVLLRQCDRNLVQIHSVFEDQLVESLFPESRLHRRMAHRLRVGPGAVHTGEVTGPEEVPHTHLRHAPKTALFLALKREETLTLHELGGLVRKRDIGRKDTGRGIAPIVLTVEAPEQKRH